MNGEEVMDGEGSLSLSAAVQAQIALGLMADEGAGLALAAQHRLEPAEAYALRDRLAANADELFSARTEALALELAVCQAELVRLVQLAERRRTPAVLRRWKVTIAPAVGEGRRRLFDMALPLARRLPEPVKVFLRRRLR